MKGGGWEATMAQEAETPNPGNAISVALNAVDFEISELRSTQKSSGWTLWTLLAALAGAVWLITEQLEGNRVSAFIVGRLLVCLFLLSDTVALLAAFFRSVQPIDEAPEPRWRQSSLLFDPAGGYLGVSVSVARQVILLVILPMVWPDAPVWLRRLTYVYYGLALCLVVLAVSLVPLRTFLSVTQGVLERRVRQVMCATLSIWGGALFIQYVLLGAVTHGQAPVENYRVAGLVVVASFILDFLVHTTYRSPLLDSLIQIRRNLTSGRLDPESAMRRAEIIALGARRVDIVRLGVDRLLRIVDRLTSETRSMEMRVPVLESLVQEGKLSKAQLQKTIAPYAELILKLAEQYRHEAKKYVDRTLNFTTGDPEARAAWDEEVQRTSGDMTRAVQAANALLGRLTTLVSKS
jgi:hypothetical protein